MRLMTEPTLKTRALEVARQRGIARARDFAAAGIPRVYLQRLRDEGLLIQAGRGLYQLPKVEFSAAHSLAEAARIVPRGTICLLSALQYHGLTTQTPHEIWMLLASKDWAPKSSSIAIKVVRASGAALTAGIERHIIESVPVPITVPAKTVADCFKHRSKVGLDVAIEALKDCVRTKRATADELWRYAAICRVQNVMRPYLEATL
jgi:predicted transcriptional regulator of viral defense system